MKLHPKIRWVAFASAASVALVAIQTSLGANAPAWLAALLTGVAAFLAGYFGPSA